MAKLLADEMLAKLARLLRVLGVPTAYVERKRDEEILAMAKALGFTLLTCDSQLALRCRKRGIPALLLPDAGAAEQAAITVASLGIAVPKFPSGTLCTLCGGGLARKSRRELSGKVYPSVLARRRLFWQCGKCSHIYWSGTHYQRLRKLCGRVVGMAGKMKAR